MNSAYRRRAQSEPAVATSPASSVSKAGDKAGTGTGAVALVTPPVPQATVAPASLGNVSGMGMDVVSWPKNTTLVRKNSSLLAPL